MYMWSTWNRPRRSMWSGYATVQVQGTESLVPNDNSILFLFFFLFCIYFVCVCVSCCAPRIEIPFSLEKSRRARVCAHWANVKLMSAQHLDLFIASWTGQSVYIASVFAFAQCEQTPKPCAKCPICYLQPLTEWYQASVIHSAWKL